MSVSGREGEDGDAGGSHCPYQCERASRGAVTYMSQPAVSAANPTIQRRSWTSNFAVLNGLSGDSGGNIADVLEFGWVMSPGAHA